jgi:hypothetical protein
MTSNLSRRLERIEELLGDEPRAGELSPALQEAVDRILNRLRPADKVPEDSEEGGKDVE